jgi:hypothetical protein
MTTVELVLPAEVLEEARLTGQTVRGGDIISIAMDAANAIANVVTVGALVLQMPALARAIRRWVSRQTHPVTVTLKGPLGRLVFDLPPNVSIAVLMDILEQAIRLQRGDFTDD